LSGHTRTSSASPGAGTDARITGSKEDAEEAAQEGFVRAWLALRRFRQGAEFRPWLLAIVANEARNRVRGRRRREGLTERAAQKLSWQPPAA
jgi:RNA polymerase sigma-70 factor (ECF subfamily)